MGYYIQVPDHKNKARQIMDMYNATKVEQPNNLSELPQDKALICVVQNPLFDAAVLIFSDRELEDFTYLDDTRRKVFLIMDKELAHKLSNYKGD